MPDNCNVENGDKDRNDTVIVFEFVQWQLAHRSSKKALQTLEKAESFHASIKSVVLIEVNVKMHPSTPCGSATVNMSLYCLEMKMYFHCPIAFWLARQTVVHAKLERFQKHKKVRSTKKVVKGIKFYYMTQNQWRQTGFKQLVKFMCRLLFLCSKCFPSYFLSKLRESFFLDDRFGRPWRELECFSPEFQFKNSDPINADAFSLICHHHLNCSPFLLKSQPRKRARYDNHRISFVDLTFVRLKTLTLQIYILKSFQKINKFYRLSTQNTAD